jgi:hypothetical protein
MLTRIGTKSASSAQRLSLLDGGLLGARSNFEGGPSALAAALTGRTARCGFHLDRASRTGTNMVRQRHRTAQADGEMIAVRPHVKFRDLAWRVVGAEGNPFQFEQRRARRTAAQMTEAAIRRLRAPKSLRTRSGGGCGEKSISLVRSDSPVACSVS